MSNPNGQPKKATCIRGHDTSTPEARGHAGVCLQCQAMKMRERRASTKRTEAIIAENTPKPERIGSVAEMDAREERRIARLEAREERKRAAREAASDAV